MTLAYLLDTNVLSEPLRPAPDAAVLAMLRTHARASAVPAPVWHELWFGCRRLPVSPRRVAIEQYLEQVVGRTLPILSYDARAASWHAAERARLAAAGQTPPFVDGQIAAIAAVHGLTLVTFNRRDFQAFQDLVVEEWRG